MAACIERAEHAVIAIEILLEPPSGKAREFAMGKGVAGKLMAGCRQFRAAFRGNHLLLFIVLVDKHAGDIKRAANALVFQNARTRRPGACRHIVECEGHDRFGRFDPHRRSREIAHQPVIDPVGKSPDFLRHTKPPGLSANYCPSSSMS